MPMPEANETTGQPGGFSLATPAAPSLASTALVLPPSRGLWTYMISGAHLVCRHGRILPALAKAWHDDGYAGNVIGGRGQSLVTQGQIAGYHSIPHDRPAVAFGVQRQPYPSTYIAEYRGVDQKGRPVTHYTDAWRRPQSIGHLTTWELDSDGYDDWLEGCLEIVSPDGLLPVQIDLAIGPVLHNARRLLDRDDQRGKRLLREQVLHLPADLVPDDLQAAYDGALEARQRKPATTPALSKRAKSKTTPGSDA